MIVFEQGALDSLYSAKHALDRAIQAYQSAEKESIVKEPLSCDNGLLFEANDNLDTAISEIQSFRDIANKERT